MIPNLTWVFFSLFFKWWEYKWINEAVRRKQVRQCVSKFYGTIWKTDHRLGSSRTTWIRPSVWSLRMMAGFFCTQYLCRQLLSLFLVCRTYWSSWGKQVWNSREGLYGLPEQLEQWYCGPSEGRTGTIHRGKCHWEMKLLSFVWIVCEFRTSQEIRGYFNWGHK